MSFGQHQALAASTVATINVTGMGTTLELVNRGATEVFVTLDQSTPAVGGANTIALPGVAGAVRRLDAAEVSRWAGKYANQAGNVTVKAISSGTPAVSVHAW